MKTENLIQEITSIYNSIENRKKELKENLLNERTTASPNLFGNEYRIKIPRDGAHAGQKGWQSYNAWDIPCPIGTPIYAVTPGVLQTFSDYGPNVIKRDGKKLFGAGFTVKSDGGYPDVYYTHLKDCTVRKGDRIQCGQLLGYVMDFPGSSYDHLHIAVEPGHHITDVIDSSGTLKCSSKFRIMGNDIEVKPESKPLETDLNSILNKEFKGQKIGDIINKNKSGFDWGAWGAELFKNFLSVAK